MQLCLSFFGVTVFYVQGLPGGFGIPGRPGEPGAKVSQSLCLSLQSEEL